PYPGEEEQFALDDVVSLLEQYRIAGAQLWRDRGVECVRVLQRPGDGFRTGWRGFGRGVLIDDRHPRARAVDPGLVLGQDGDGMLVVLNDFPDLHQAVVREPLIVLLGKFQVWEIA